MAAAEKMTEADVLKLLRKRHVRTGNAGSGEYAFMTGVRNGAGFDSNRTFDAVVMNLWPSRGLSLHVYEVKCSRGDWQRELSKPDKAEDAAKVADYFSVVASDDSIVREGELPPTWGLLVVRAGKLVCVKEAPALHDMTNRKSQPLARGFVVAMLRAGGAVPKAEADEVKAAEGAGFRRGLECGKDTEKMLEEQLASLRQKIADFERESGVQINSWSRYGNTPGEVGAAVRAVLTGEQRVKGVWSQLSDAAQRLRASADAIDKVLAAAPAEETT